jgi:hypothetical protein
MKSTFKSSGKSAQQGATETNFVSSLYHDNVPQPTADIAPASWLPTDDPTDYLPEDLIPADDDAQFKTFLQHRLPRLKAPDGLLQKIKTAIEKETPPR